MSKKEYIDECNDNIKKLYESENGGVGTLILTSSHGKRNYYSKIVQIKTRNVKGKIMHDLIVNLCEKKRIKTNVITPVIHEDHYQIVECVPEKRIVIKNVYSFDCVNEFFCTNSSCD